MLKHERSYRRCRERSSRSRWRPWPRRAAVAAATTARRQSSSGGQPRPASTPAAAPAADALGTAKKASGKPIVLGLLNLESGPVTFPEYRQAAELAVKYINDYKGGIGGRPVKLASCADRRPAGDVRPLRQPDRRQEPDGDPRRRRHRRAGRVPGVQAQGPGLHGRHPVHARRVQRPQRGAVLLRVSVGDNLATVQYATKTLGVKKASVVYTDDSQGKATGLGVIVPAFKAAGADVKAIPVSPSARRTCQLGGGRGDLAARPTRCTSTRRTRARPC